MCSHLASVNEIQQHNKTLRHLDLQSNPLTLHGGSDVSGFVAFCNMLKSHNTTLIHLNLWRCQIGEQGGRELVQALDANHKLRVLEIGYNDFRMDSQIKIAANIDANMARYGHEMLKQRANL